MATIGTKLTLLLALLVAALVPTASQEDNKYVKVAAAQPAVTIYNPAGLVVKISNDDQNVKVTTKMKMETVHFTQAQADLQISVADGNVVDVNVHDGDAIILFPDPNDPRNWRALKVQVSGITELLTPQQPSSLPQVHGPSNRSQVEENPSSLEIKFNPAKLP